MLALNIMSNDGETCLNPTTRCGQLSVRVEPWLKSGSLGRAEPSRGSAAGMNLPPAAVLLLTLLVHVGEAHSFSRPRDVSGTDSPVRCSVPGTLFIYFGGAEKWADSNPNTDLLIFRAASIQCYNKRL